MIEEPTITIKFNGDRYTIPRRPYTVTRFLLALEQPVQDNFVLEQEDPKNPEKGKKEYPNKDDEIDLSLGHVFRYRPEGGPLS